MYQKILCFCLYWSMRNFIYIPVCKNVQFSLSVPKCADYTSFIWFKESRHNNLESNISLFSETENLIQVPSEAVSIHSTDVTKYLPASPQQVFVFLSFSAATLQVYSHFCHSLSLFCCCCCCCYNSSKDLICFFFFPTQPKELRFPASHLVTYPHSHSFH